MAYSPTLADGKLSEAARQQGPLIQLYRVVGAQEYASIQAIGGYSPAISGWGEKQFWLSMNDAHWFAANEFRLDSSVTQNFRFVVSSLVTQRTLGMATPLFDAGHPFVSFSLPTFPALNADARRFGGIFTMQTIPPEP